MSKDLMTLAMQEINQGMAPGSLLQQVNPQETGPTMPVPPETPEPGWRQQLSQLQGTPTAAAPAFSSDMLDIIQQTAATEQDRMLSAMFSDVLPAKGADTSRLPPALDRHLEKILSS